MIIESIELKNYRNYELLSLPFQCGTNILYGDNGQGKTNILEAVYVASTSRSHRASKEKELIRFGEDESHIKMHVKKKDTPYRIDIHLKKNKAKGIAINGLPIKKASELFGIVNVVFFAPEDLFIIKNGPSERRRFLDMELCQLDKIYVYNLIQYNKVILQRNKLLKEIDYRSDLLETMDIWDLQMVKFGKEVITRRRNFVVELNKLVQPIHEKLSGGKEQLILIYEPDCNEEHLAEEIGRNRERDLKLRTTTVGPHRDDISFILNGIDIRKYGSQGQQRTAALSLKLAEIELVKKIIRDTPVLLLDDVFSELDSHRQNHLLDSLSDIQTIITCTGLDELMEHRCQMDQVYQIVNGSVVQGK
ncbi:MAG: DNA replication/repair protein RecF [Lachnospiraceae bacterium]|nr:DNA replication/repair protein RecF [Lachnospiraceae bacterium]